MVVAESTIDTHVLCKPLVDLGCGRGEGGWVGIGSPYVDPARWAYQRDWLGDQAQVDEKTDAAVHWTNILYPLANAICFPNSYPLDSDLSSGL